TSIGGTTIKTGHEWTNILVNKDFDEFTIDERSGKIGDSFWDCYPDLELKARQFVYQECSKTEATFTVETSVESCKLDLRRFGVKFTANSSRSYFLGHEREDVVKHRQAFVKYFVEREQHFYTITDDAVPQWRIPTSAPTVLLCHDKSTYKCGEITAKRWIMPDNAPFYNKGRGRSIMCSDLLVMHPSGPFFSLTEIEYSEALKTYPNLNDDCDINYETNSASAAITLGGDNYFNNQ
ncbi:unnamed protein product, partial [Rotaria magnacalcarata]